MTKIPKLEASFHQTLENKTAPGGKVDMFLIHDSEGESLFSLAVPQGRGDVAMAIVRRCNAHEALVNALKTAHGNVKTLAKLYGVGLTHEYEKKISDALALAELGI